VRLLDSGIGGVLSAWQPYVLVVVGLTAVVLTQLAFRRGPLSTSLPLVMTISPVLGVLIGSVVYDEGIRDSAPALAAEAAFLVVLTVATLVLARLEQDRPGGSAQACRVGR
jgi:asparagine N-glycosylation enzyme membrane subunit Stt3